MGRRYVQKIKKRETGEEIQVKDPGMKDREIISLKTSPQIKQRGKVYPEIAPDTPSKKKKQRRAMLSAYCTNNECDELGFHRLVYAGSKCKCGYPLSWLGKKLEDRNKYSDGPVNSGNADRWK
ncbi:hypothetical protein KAR91_04670 [Candidatus Pacearchaeota archaeon]|nr:hypothetical protein [Candidatus Pacearchaeota archaeon]